MPFLFTYTTLTKPHRRMSPGFTTAVILLLVFLSGTLPIRAAEPHPPIPIHFKLAQPGFVTLVIENAQGVRVRNLVSETPFPAGDNVAWWDGLDDLGRDPQAAAHAVYHIPGRLVAPGRYRVRGLVRPKINLVYELTPYNEGHPPWHSADTSSQWLANHTPPSAVLFVPESQAPPRRAGQAKDGQILVGSFVTEGGSGLAWLNLDGRKLHGQMWIGGVWTGATQLTRDDGPQADPKVYAYTGAWWHGDKYNDFKEELRIYALLKSGSHAQAPKDKRFGYGEDVPVLQPTYKFSKSSNASATRNGLSGLAARNGLLIASLPKSDELLFINAREHRVLGTAPLADPRGLAFDRDGRLLALTGTNLVRFTLGPDPVKLPPPTRLVTHGLDDPQQIALDAQGRIYLSDRGQSHQVKVFSAGGKFLRAIGAPGKPGVGPYDPTKMHNPNGLTIDSRGRLWVAETDFEPKRVSLWTLDGKFIRAFYGPPEYGGGGVLDPLDPTRFFYAGMVRKPSSSKRCGH